MADAQTSPSFHSAPVIEAWDETPALRGIALDLGALPATKVSPGQVLRLRTPSGEGYFALSALPGQERRAEILVKRGGAVADEAAAASPGTSLAVSEPFGRGFPVGEAEGKDVILFAAGSGISAIRTVVRHLLADRGRFGKAVLFYGQRAADEFAYRGEHAEWQRGGVEVVLCCSGPGADWAGPRGHVHAVARERALGGVRPAETVAYLCGMKPMVAGVTEVLREAGLPEQRAFLNF